jgi:hypothetical protein
LSSLSDARSKPTPKSKIARKCTAFLRLHTLTSPTRFTEDPKIFRDTTERKEAEEALRQAHADLGARAEELVRFNRIVVGREMRMIELKKEINELRERLGEPAPFPLDFEKGENADG